jgi:16S rRNA G1207 methylase RsmC
VSRSRPYPQEALLIDAIPEMSGDRVLCTSPGAAQFAGTAARAWPHAVVSCTYFDLYRANLASNHWHESPPNLRINCAADLPDGEVDVVAFPFSASGEAELTRELIQVGYQRLPLAGKMYASTDNRDDSWLRDQLGKVFNKLERRASSAGVLYVGTKTEPLKRKRNFACEFAFRDRGRLIRAYSRPGVFSHRSVDAGARQLLNEMQIDSGTHVLDIGCGAGVVALAAACRADGVTVHAVDSSCRAIQCTQHGAQLNGLDNLTAELNADGRFAGAGSYDLALANPPYYSSFRIARHFLIAGRNALRSGGKILVVTKRPDWYQQNMSEWYDAVTVSERKSYYVVQGVRPTD